MQQRRRAVWAYGGKISVNDGCEVEKGGARRTVPLRFGAIVLYYCCAITSDDLSCPYLRLWYGYL